MLATDDAAHGAEGLAQPARGGRAKPQFRMRVGQCDVAQVAAPVRRQHVAFERAVALVGMGRQGAEADAAHEGRNRRNAGLAERLSAKADEGCQHHQPVDPAC
ncbi:hypothetical protein D9M72_555380 [compost metagenome]